MTDINNRPRLLLATLLLATLLLVGCEGGDIPKTGPVEDMLTQRPIPKDKIPVTVLVKYGFSIHAFEKAVEKKFPRLELVQVGNYTREQGILEYERRMQHDDLTDIVMTWPLNVAERYWKDRLLDLSGMPFTSRYNTAMLDSIARDGKLYHLPGPAQIRGIVYNKTLFQEKGWNVPHDFASFVELCQTIEASGLRSLQLGFANAEVLETAWMGFSYGNGFSTPADAQCLADYNSGKGSLGSHFGPALDTFQTMIDAGIWQKGDLNLKYPQRELLFFTRRCAMIEDSVLMARRGYALTGSTDQFALMPFFSPASPGDWVRLQMVCYIALNKHLTEPQNKEKYALVLELMEYITSPEGQLALAEDTGGMYSSMKNMPPPDVPEIVDIASTLKHGRYAVFPELENAQPALRRGLADLLAGTRTRDEVIRMVDEQNIPPPPPAPVEVLAQATAAFSLTDTGNLFTDTMRAKTGADVALFLDNGKDGAFNGKGINARLYAGPQTVDDVHRIFPILQYDEAGMLQVLKMKGKDLITTLEYANPEASDPQNYFYYFSGLRMEYAPAATPGTRIRKLSDADGKPIDPERVYTVAAMDGSIPVRAILSTTDTGISIRDLLIAELRTRKNISPSRDGRFIVRQP